MTEVLSGRQAKQALAQQIERHETRGTAAEVDGLRLPGPRMAAQLFEQAGMVAGLCGSGKHSGSEVTEAALLGAEWIRDVNAGHEIRGLPGSQSRRHFVKRL